VADLITLSCPNCGAALTLTADVDRFACAHCGMQHIVRRRGGTISLAPVLEGIAKLQATADKSASELAIARVSREIEALHARRAYLSDPSNRSRVGGIGTVFTGIGFLLMFGGICLSNDSSLVAVALGGVLALAGIGYVITRVSRERQAVDRMILAKIQELEWHKRIVSS
jgi:DNA-directed RNA polymerase subunit RPC12/RpoP